MDEFLVLTTELEYENTIQQKLEVLNREAPMGADDKEWKAHRDTMIREIEGLGIEHYADYPAGKEAHGVR